MIRKYRNSIVACSVLCLFTFFVAISSSDELPPGVKDTQNPKDQPPSPEESVKRFKLPEGFSVTLFAGEPDVRQPIGMAWDDRGRLWVAECYSYPAWIKDSPKDRDRIIILEDTDGDGKADKRTVFYDKCNNLTSVAIGFGGVWALCAPNLLFFPDKDGDDKPDGKPEIILDGWATNDARHNLVNGLTWGPDGWLYGCHGITAESKPGVPGTKPDDRVKMNCGVWRYHSINKKIEVVCHGTTNPWGLDFDEHGEGFFTNCVIGHLWHMIPGAHYKRMYGLDYNRYAYELIDATSEHLHWAGGPWTDSRDGKGRHSDAGGGHAHSGCMVYLGDTFPAEYRNRIFMGNIHGNRLNIDKIERKGNSYVGKRSPDFLMSDNPWFRPIAQTFGPDGAVYVSDWCDLGECHDHDGTHRSSGRIYRVQYGKPKPKESFDLRKKDERELVELVFESDVWASRRALVLLAERAPKNKDIVDWIYTFLQIGRFTLPDSIGLRVLWALNSVNSLDDRNLQMRLRRKDGIEAEHIRAWMVRLLCFERVPTAETIECLNFVATHSKSANLRLQLASALHRLPEKERLKLAANLLAHSEDSDDRCQPLLIWYGIEPAVATHPEEGLKLAAGCKMPKIRQFIARRLTETGKADTLDALVTSLGKVAEEDKRRDLLQGMRDGLKGRREEKMPAAWREVYPSLASAKSRDVRRLSALMALTFNDKAAQESLTAQLADASQPTEDRTLALQALVEKGMPELVPVLFKLLDDRALRGPAIRAMAAFRDETTPKEILRVYKSLNDAEKQDAISTLASRPVYAIVLLDAVESKKIPRGDVTPFTARQIVGFKNKELAEKLEKVWGQVQQSSAEKKAQMAKYKKQLTADVLAKADLSHGRMVFTKTCAQCHTLFGEGGRIGPDITGSDRANLDYVLENSVDPSAVIGGDYRLTDITTKRGRSIPGIIVEETERAVTVQTATERIVVAKADIEDRTVSNVSMMPEGQLEKLSAEELRDLVAYLASKQQVALPKK